MANLYSSLARFTRPPAVCRSGCCLLSPVLGNSVYWRLVHRVFAGTQVAGSILMSMNRKRASRSQKIFYVVSLLIVFSMVLSLIYVAIAPAAVP